MTAPRDHRAWRVDLLLQAGLAVEEARALGADSALDLHALLNLIDRGCPPGLAARIVAPLDAAPSEAPLDWR